MRLFVEVLHHNRFVHTVAQAERVLSELGPDVIGLPFDVSHVLASADDAVAWATQRADRVERVHLRDAVPGNLNRGIGSGEVDFPGTIAALERGGFTGTYILELETHDIAEQEREADALRSREEIVAILTALSTGLGVRLAGPRFDGSSASASAVAALEDYQLGRHQVVTD